MADTIGDVFSRSYRSGRAIGDDFSSWRFQRGAEKVRQKYTEIAAQEGKQIEDYRTQIQGELDTLYTKSGSRKRSVTGADGVALNDATLAGYDKRALESSNIRAGQQAEAGDVAGSRRTIARTNFATGQYDQGIQNRQAGDIIDASTAAIGKGPNGGYDTVGAAGAMSGIQARYGNMGEAIKADQSREGFRFDAAAGIGGKLAMMLDNPAQFGDQIVGTFEGLKQYLPELRNIDIRMQSGMLYIYTNGKATGSLDTPEEIDQVKSMLASATRDPKGVLGGWAQARADEAKYQRERSDKLTDDTNAALRDVIKKFDATGGPGAAQAAQSVIAAQQKAAAGGWKFAAARDDGAIPATFGDRAFLILPAQPNGADGTPGYQSRVIDAVTGQTVNPQELGAQGNSVVEYSLKLGELMSQQNRDMNREDLRFQIDLLNQVGGAAPASSGRRSGGNSRAERNNNPGNIEDRGQFRGMPGYLGSDGRFARFASVEDGQRAMHHQLQRYMDGKTTGAPLRTVNDIVGTWSPQSDPTNQAGSTGNYARYVARRLGVGPNTPLSREQIPQLAAAMAEFESGNTQSPVQQSLPPAAVASASPVQAPASRSPAVPAQQGVDSTRLLQRRDQMLAAEQEMRRWNEELVAFDRQNPTQSTPVFGRGDNIVAWNRSGDPQVLRLREQLVRAHDEAKSKFDALRAMVKQGTRELTAQTQQRGIDDRFAAIKARVAGNGGGGDTAATNPAGNSVLNSIISQSLR